MSLRALFPHPERIRGIFAKFPTPNDDSGRHGVVVPVAAHTFFPAFPGFDPAAAENYTVPIRTVWNQAGGAERKSSYKHYHRYPERRLTALGSRKLDERRAGALLVVGRREDDERTFEIAVLWPDDPGYPEVVQDLGFADTDAGSFVVLHNWRPIEHAGALPRSVQSLIARFDALKARGYVPSLRAGGSRGVGNTFEIEMGGTENNIAGPDLEGIEFKSMLRKEFKRGEADETDLFLKEPRWIEELGEAAEPVRRLGYVDDDGRDALYSGVKARQNGHGLRLCVDWDSKSLRLEHEETPVASWSFDTLAQSLSGKLKDTLYALANARRTAEGEEFFYHTLYYLADPSVEELMRIVEQGGVSVQLRMHIRKTGSVRNHGTQFRVSMRHWPQLYARVLMIRGTGKED